MDNMASFELADNVQPETRGVGPLIRELREARKVGLREFARVLDVDPGNWSRFERGIDPMPPGRTGKALEALGITGDMQEYHDVYGEILKSHPDRDVRTYVIEILGVK